MKSESDLKESGCNFIFLNIFKTFRMAVHPSKFIIALSALIIICLVGLLMDLSQTVVMDGNTTELDSYIDNPSGVAGFREVFGESGKRMGVFATMQDFVLRRFNGAVNALLTLDAGEVKGTARECIQAIAWALKYHFIYFALFCVIKLVIIAVAGGAICRCTAMEFARGEKPRLAESVNYSLRHVGNFFAAPLIPVAIVMILGLVVYLIGLAGNIPCIGELVIGASMLFNLFVGAIIAVTVIGAIGGFSLMYPAISYENSDCFDATSRAYSYVYSRPWRFIFYTLVAGIYGAVCYTFVRFFAFLVLFTTYKIMELGVFVKDSGGMDKLGSIWSKPTFSLFTGYDNLLPGTWSQSAAAFLIHLGLLVVVGLVIAFVISFYFSANTVIYALLRQKVDKTSFSEVYSGLEEDESMYEELPTIQPDTGTDSNKKPEAL